MKTRLPLTLLAYVSCFAASAATIEKNGTNGILSDSAVWSGGVVPGSGDVAAWGGSSDKGTESNPLLLGSDTSWAGILHDSPENGTLFIGGDEERKTLTLGTSGIFISSGDDVIPANNITLDSHVTIGGDQVWRASSSWKNHSTITILGDLSGSGNLSTNATGGVQVVVKGTASAYTGTLEIGEWSNFTFENGLTGGNINMGNDTAITVAVQGSQTYSSNLSSVAYNGGPEFRLTSGNLVLEGTNHFGAGDTTELGGGFSFKLKADTGASIEFRTGSSTFSGSTGISGGGSVTFAGTSSFAQKLDISGEGTNVAFQGNAHTLAANTGQIVVGSGAILDLSQGRISFVNEGNHINKADAVVIQGTLKLADFSYAGSLNQLADYSQNRRLDGGTIEITGTTHRASQGITITANGGSFLVTNESSTLTLDGNGNDSMMNFAGEGTLKLGGAGNLVFNSDANRSFFNGSGVLEKVGSGTLTINGGSNGFTGSMILSDGTLVLNHENALGSSSVSTDLVYRGGVLDLGNLALKNISIEFDGTSAADVLNKDNFLGLLNVGKSGIYEISAQTVFGSGFKASVDTEFVLKENLTVGFKTSGLKNYILGTNAIGFTGEGYDLSISDYGAVDGAVYASSVSFHDMGNISFSGNASASRWSAGGAVSAESGTITFERVGDIEFIGNQSNGTLDDGMGGALYAFGGGSMDGVGNVTFSSNSSTYSGGAVASDGSFSFLNAEAVVFEGNESINGAGGAVYISADSLSFDSIASLSVKGNNAAEAGGAFYAQNDVLVSSVAGSIEFSDNHSASMNGGAIASENSHVVFSSVGDVSFVQNSAGRAGGAISAWGDVVFDGVGNVVFDGNAAEYGGAISSDTVTIQGLAGNVEFRNNQASEQGGALSVAYQIDLTADGGDISFAGNTAMGGGDRNAIYFNGDGIYANLDAWDGHSIVFEDGWSANSDDSVISVFINGKGEDSTGQVKMTGEGSQMNVRANTTVSRGSFIVEKGANYGYYSSDWAQDEDYLKTELLIEGGVVVAGENSSINSHRVRLESGAMLCVNQSAVVRAETIDINGGLVISFGGDLGRSVQPGGMLQADTINIDGIAFGLNNSPVNFQGAVINLGGTIVLNDSLIDYTAVEWLVDRQFTLGSFGDDNSQIEGMFGGLISQTSGGKWVYAPDDAGRILGSWEFGWDDRNLVASWTASAPVPEPSACLFLLCSFGVAAMRRRR